MKGSIFLLLFLPVVAFAAVTPARIVQTCKLEDGTDVLLQARYDRERDAERLYVAMDGKNEIAFTDLPDADYVGQIVLSKCLNHVLIFAIEYGAPYRKGVVIRRAIEDRTIQRIDFSEKALPKLLYIGKGKTALVIPNIGNEVSQKYLIYEFEVGKGQPEEAIGQDVLPPEAGFTVIPILQ